MGIPHFQTDPECGAQFDPCCDQRTRRNGNFGEQKHPAGSGMERVGVSKSLLGTYDQHWDLPVILPLTMMQHV